MISAVYCFTAGIVFSVTWWVAVGYPSTWQYFLTLSVVALLIVVALAFKREGKT